MQQLRDGGMADDVLAVLDESWQQGGEQKMCVLTAMIALTEIRKRWN